jgi:hypothetical protein
MTSYDDGGIAMVCKGPSLPVGGFGIVCNALGIVLGTTTLYLGDIGTTTNINGTIITTDVFSSIGTGQSTTVSTGTQTLTFINGILTSVV